MYTVSIINSHPFSFTFFPRKKGAGGADEKRWMEHGTGADVKVFEAHPTKSWNG